MKHGVYPRVNGNRQSPSTWDKLMRGLKVMRGVDVSGEAHQFLKDNPDLTNGVQLTVSAAGVPFRAISYLDTGLDAAGIVHDVAAGNYVEALIGTTSVVLGEGAGYYLKNFQSNEVFERAVSTAVEEASSTMLENDCYVCK